MLATDATAAQVDFTCSASIDYTNGGTNVGATKVVLTNTSGKTGYVANDTVYIRDLKATESGYATVTVTVTASLHTGSEGTFYQAWSLLSGQGQKIYPKISGVGLLRPAFEVGTSTGQVYAAYVAETAKYGSDMFSSFKDASDGTSAISASTATAVATYTCYFSIAPKYDGDKANGAAMGNTNSYDQATDHDTENVLTVTVSGTNS